MLSQIKNQSPEYKIYTLTSDNLNMSISQQSHMIQPNEQDIMQDIILER